MHKATILMAAVVAASLPTAGPAFAGTYSVLYQFSAAGGYSPDSLVALPSGSLVGSAVGGTLSNPHSVFFKLDPPLAGQTAWIYSVIYDTKNFPVANQAFSDPNTLLTDQAGNVYGRSDAGPQIDAGTIYRLSPPASGRGSWTCTILYHRYNLHGFNVSPERLVYIDHTARHIYGLGYDWNEAGSTFASILGEQMFRLDLPDPPAAATLNIISPIIIKLPEGRNAVTALVPAQGGVFYGATKYLYSSDAIFRVTPPAPGATQGTVQTIGLPTDSGGNSVEPAAISVDLSGRVAGVGTNTSETENGVAFEVLPPSAAGGQWHSKSIYDFTSSPKFALSNDGIFPLQLLSHNGLFFGLTFSGGGSTHCQLGCGTLFELAAPPPGSNATQWSEHPVHQFGLTASDGRDPRTLVPFTSTDGTYTLYGTTSESGSASSGTIFRYVP